MTARDVIRLLACTDPQSLLATAMEVGLKDADARAGAVFLAQDDGWLRLAASLGYGERLAERFRMIAPTAAFPVSIAVRERRPVHGRTDDGIDGPAAQPPIGGPLAAPVGYIALPLLMDDRCLGAMVVQLSRPGPLSEQEELTLAMVATVCAHRLDHLLALESTGIPAGSPRLDQAVRLLLSSSRARRLELAMSSGEIGSFDWDMSGDRVVWDERLCRLFGVEPDEFDKRVQTFFALIHPDDRPAVHAAVAEARETGAFHAVYRILRPDGGIRWIDARGSVGIVTGGQADRMIGVAMDRTEERERDARLNAHRDFVLQMTQTFAGALSTRDVLDAMIGTVLPALGAWAIAIHVEQHGRMLLAGARGYSDEAMPRLRTLGSVTEGSPMTEVLRSDTPMFIESLGEYLERFPDPRVVPAAGHEAFALLPLRTADGVTGTCLISYGAARTFSSEEQAIYVAMAGVLAQSLARARLFDQRRHQMTELQQAMLPRRLPDVAGLEIAARYVPGAEGMEVGGDWYDVLPSSDGTACLVIGDVQGHSAQAAAVMGQLRTALIAHAAEGQRLQHLMYRTNETLCGLDTDLFATCCICDLDPEDGTLRLVRAGHPYPMVLQCDGRVRELEGPGGLPLGCDPDDMCPVVETRLDEGETLLLYSDGLVDDPERDYDDALAEIARTLKRWADEGVPDPAVDFPGLGVLAERIVKRARDHVAHDDVAVLLVRRRTEYGRATPASGTATGVGVAAIGARTEDAGPDAAPAGGADVAAR